MNKEELMTLLTPQGTSHCSCLEHSCLFMDMVMGTSVYIGKEESLHKHTGYIVSSECICLSYIGPKTNQRMSREARPEVFCSIC